MASVNDEWHKVREEKLRAHNLAQQRASLESRIAELERECSSLQQQAQQDTAKRELLDAKKRQYMRSACTVGDDHSSSTCDDVAIASLAFCPPCLAQYTTWV